MILNKISSQRKHILFNTGVMAQDRKMLLPLANTGQYQERRTSQPESQHLHGIFGKKTSKYETACHVNINVKKNISLRLMKANKSFFPETIHIIPKNEVMRIRDCLLKTHVVIYCSATTALEKQRKQIKFGNTVEYNTQSQIKRKN